MLENMRYDNDVAITILHGDGTKDSTTFKNSVCDDFLGGFGGLYFKNPFSNGNYLQAVLFPDGPLWSGWTWNPRDPWVPYACQSNAAVDSGASPISQPWSSDTFDQASFRYKLYYQWIKLESDFTLKAVGLTMWDNFGYTECGCVANTYQAFPVGTLAVLPSPLQVKGSNGGAQTPDILQVSYYLSLVGV
jgi:hypothetical protein